MLEYKIVVNINILKSSFSFIENVRRREITRLCMYVCKYDLCRYIHTYVGILPIRPRGPGFLKLSTNTLTSIVM